jgi:hypothetical protein
MAGIRKGFAGFEGQRPAAIPAWANGPGLWQIVWCRAEGPDYFFEEKKSYEPGFQP